MRIPIMKMTGVMGGKKATPWYLDGGVAPIALYDAVSATSEVISRVNIVNPGTYDLSPTGSPSWSSLGWTGFSTTKYYDTGIVPSGSNMSFIAVTNAITGFGYAFGVEEVPNRLGLGTKASATQQEWKYGATAYADYASTNLPNKLVWLITNGKLFINGSEIDTLSFGNLANALTITLGVMRTGASTVDANVFAGKILSFGIYSSTLIDANAIALSQAAMLNFQ